MSEGERMGWKHKEERGHDSCRNGEQVFLV